MEMEELMFQIIANQKSAGDQSAKKKAGARAAEMEDARATLDEALASTGKKAKTGDCKKDKTSPKPSRQGANATSVDSMGDSADCIAAAIAANAVAAAGKDLKPGSLEATMAERAMKLKEKKQTDGHQVHCVRVPHQCYVG